MFTFPHIFLFIFFDSRMEDFSECLRQTITLKQGGGGEPTARVTATRLTGPMVHRVNAIDQEQRAERDDMPSDL